MKPAPLLWGLIACIALVTCQSASAQESSHTMNSDAIELAVNAGNGGASQMALSPDGRFFAVPNGNAIELWDVEKDRHIRTFVGPIGAVFNVAMSHDGKQVATGTRELGKSEIFVWNIETGRVDAKLDVVATRNYGSGPAYAFIEALAFTPDGGRIIAVGNFDTRSLGHYKYSTEIVRIIDLRTGTTLKSLETLSSSGATSVDLSPDGRSFAIGFYGGITRLFDFDGHLIRSLSSSNSRGTVETLAFSPDGRLLAFANRESGADESKIKTVVEIWDVSTGKMRRSLLSAPGGRSVGIAWSPDGNSIATRGDAGLQIWNARTGDIEKQNHDLGPFGSGVRYEPSGSAIISSGWTMMMVDANTLQPIKHFGKNVGGLLAGTDPGSEDALISVRPCSVYALNVYSGLIKEHFKRDNADGLCPVGEVSRDGKKFVRSFLQGSENAGKLVYTDLSIGPEVKILRSDATSLPSLAADGNTVAVQVLNAIDILNTQTGTVLRSVPGKPSHLAFALSPDAKRLIAGENVGTYPSYPNPTVQIWNLASGAASELAQYNFSSGGSQPGHFLFSSDSRYVVGLGTSTIHYSIDYWSVERQQLVRRLNLPDNRTINFGGMSFHPDGDKVLAGSWDAQMRLWDLNSGALLRTYSGLTAWPNRLIFAAGGQRIVSGGADAIRIWKTDTGEILASIYVTTDGEWLEITPEGFFDASPNGAELLSVVQRLDSYSVDQFYDALHRPDLLHEKLAGDPHGRVREAAAKLDLGKVLRSGSPPVVAVDAAPLTTSDEQTTVRATVTDKGGGIGKVEWRVNGTTLGIETVPPEPIHAGRTISVRRTLMLEPDQNRIEVVAYNAEGLIASIPARTTINLANRALTPPRLYVLAIGVNDYWDSRLHLAYAAPDAQAFGEAMQKGGQGLYDRVEVTLLIDGQATTARMNDTFQALGQKIGPRDVFVLFMAGHGMTVDGRFYFIPQEFRDTGDESVVTDGIGQDQLQQWLGRIAARKSILIFDACESGTLTKDQSARRGMEEITAVDRLIHAMGRSILTATTDDKPAMEGIGGHGVFTYTLLNGLWEAQLDPDGLIDVMELASYVDRRVPEISYDTFKIRQVPQSRIVGSNFPITHRVATNLAAPGATVPRTPTHVVIAPATVRQAATDTSPAVIELAPGTQVRVVQTSEGWVLIARDGKPLGYVLTQVLALMQ